MRQDHFGYRDFVKPAKFGQQFKRRVGSRFCPINRLPVFVYSLGNFLLRHLATLRPSASLADRSVWNPWSEILPEVSHECQQQMSKQVSRNVATSFVTIVSQMKPSDQLWKDFGGWIRKQREDQHLSQSGVASRAGIDRQQVYRIEAGISGTKRDTVIAIATALSLNKDETLKRAGFAGAFSTDDPEGFYAGLSKLSPDAQRIAKRQIKAIIDALAEEENPDTDYIDDEDPNK
jgi:transcriptional regulator with XRE-family HTH domain